MGIWLGIGMRPHIEFAYGVEDADSLGDGVGDGVERGLDIEMGISQDLEIGSRLRIELGLGAADEPVDVRGYEAGIGLKYGVGCWTVAGNSGGLGIGMAMVLGMELGMGLWG